MLCASNICIYIILIKSTSEFFTYKELFNHNSVVDVNSKYVHKQERKKRKKIPEVGIFKTKSSAASLPVLLSIYEDGVHVAVVSHHHYYQFCRLLSLFRKTPQDDGEIFTNIFVRKNKHFPMVFTRNRHLSQQASLC